MIIIERLQMFFVVTSGIVLAPLFLWAWNRFAVEVFNLKKLSFIEAYAGIVLILLITPNDAIQIDGNRMLGL